MCDVTQSAREGSFLMSDVTSLWGVFVFVFASGQFSCKMSASSPARIASGRELDVYLCNLMHSCVCVPLYSQACMCTYAVSCLTVCALAVAMQLHVLTVCALALSSRSNDSDCGKRSFSPVRIRQSGGRNPRSVCDQPCPLLLKMRLSRAEKEYFHARTQARLSYSHACT